MENTLTSSHVDIGAPNASRGSDTPVKSTSINPTPLTVRRATVADIAGIQALWSASGYAVEELQKRLVEFQVVSSPEGEIQAAIGFRVDGRNGEIHNEAYLNSDRADEIRAEFWDRIQNLSRNHGLFRLWTQHDAAFWDKADFTKPPEGSANLPTSFGEQEGNWKTLALKDEKEISVTMDQEFELFKVEQTQYSEKAMRQAGVFKWCVYATIGSGLLYGGYLIISSFLPGG